MSGESIAYHLRTNKNIERKLFLDLLQRIGRHVNISAYKYIGFAGPFAEDFKEIHNHLRINRMVSIEMDENVQVRQKFNYPAKFIEHYLGSSTEYISQIDESDENVIFWLDFTKVDDLKQQLTDFRNLISKLSVNDVVKITLNAHTASIANNPPSGKTLAQHRADIFEKRADVYCNWPVAISDVNEKNYPNTLLRVLKNSVNGVSQGFEKKYFQPLSAFSYKDGMQMLTLTGIILDGKNSVEKNVFFHKTRIRHWPYKNIDWSAPLNISVPALSAKERMAIDAELPIAEKTLPAIPAGHHLHRSLGFSPSSLTQIQEGIAMLENYAKFYRNYPTFSKTEI